MWWLYGSRRRLWLAIATSAALLGAPLGWVVTDRLEQDDGFCIACHLRPAVPLHIGNFDDMRARPPVSLAAAHAGAGNEEREDGGFRCIDCHGGTSWRGRARVKLLSARDAFWYVTGRFDEPDGMRWPLWDDDCRKCHDSFEEEGARVANPRFHGLAVHNVRLGVACVACHLTHERGGLTSAAFLHPAPVRAQCARCHPEFQEETP